MWTTRNFQRQMRLDSQKDRNTYNQSVRPDRPSYRFHALMTENNVGRALPSIPGQRIKSMYDPALSPDHLIIFS